MKRDDRDPRSLLEQRWFDRCEYPFVPHELEVEGGRMRYVDEGSGPAILFVHGTPSWSFEWRALVRELARDHRCIAPDHIGFGLSDKPQAWSYRLADHTANLERLVDQLGIERATLVVHDFGGPIALPLVWRRAGLVERIVLANTWLWPLDNDPSFARNKARLGSPLMRWLYLSANFSARVMLPMAWGRHRPLSRAVHRHYTRVLRNRAERIGTWRFVEELLREAAFDDLWQQRGALAKLPALIVWGMADRLVAPLQLARWRELLPEARVIELAGVGHFPQDEAPELVLPELQSFVGGALPRAR